MTYAELKQAFRDHEAGMPENHLTGYIVFTVDSYEEVFDKASRTYEVSSFNKAFLPNMGSRSIYGSSLDGADCYAKLHLLMRDEQGGVDGWKVERCYMDRPNTELWGQIGSTFVLTPQETETLMRFDDQAQKLFAALVRARRYTFTDQFYAPSDDGKEDIFFSIDNHPAALRENAAHSDRINKVWCRMGIVLTLGAGQFARLQTEGDLALNQLNSLLEQRKYRVEGSCLFEAMDNEAYVSPEADSYIDYFQRSDEGCKNG